MNSIRTQRACHSLERSQGWLSHSSAILSVHWGSARMHKKKMRALFAALDDSGDGVVDLEEFRESRGDQEPANHDVVGIHGLGGFKASLICNSIVGPLVLAADSVPHNSHGLGVSSGL
eukprot:3975302-Amphidinium_carterae.1